MKNDAVYLRHILECIRRAEENTSPGYDAFMGSHTLQDAVLRNLQRWPNRLSACTTKQNPPIPQSTGARFPGSATC